VRPRVIGLETQHTPRHARGRIVLSYADAQDDVKALESIAGFLADASDGEKNVLATAAAEAHREAVAHHLRADLASDYASWMEDMFVEGWDGNRRIP
jgi:hypothetical protein